MQQLPQVYIRMITGITWNIVKMVAPTQKERKEEVIVKVYYWVDVNIMPLHMVTYVE